jgi:hypothetical protein
MTTVAGFPQRATSHSGGRALIATGPAAVVPGNPESHPHLRRRQTEGGPHDSARATQPPSTPSSSRRSRSGSPTTSISTIFPRAILNASTFRHARGHRRAVGPEHDVRVEHREQCLEVTAARRGHEGLDDLPLAGEIRLGQRGRSLYPTASAARELPCRGGRAPDHRSDLLERHGEQVVQHERDPLGRRQRLEHHEQCQADRVVFAPSGNAEVPTAVILSEAKEPSPEA